MSDINLLSHRRGARSKKPLKFVRIFAIVSLLLVLGISVVFFILKLQSPLVSLEQQEAQFLTQLTTMKKKYENLLILKDRLDRIGKIFELQKDVASKLETITSAVPSGASVDSLSIDEKAIAITLSAQDLNSSDSFLINFVDLSETKRMFKTVTLNELSFDEKTGYRLTVQGDLPK